MEKASHSYSDIKLNVKIGWLRVRKGYLVFENLGRDGFKDAEAMNRTADNATTILYDKQNGMRTYNFSGINMPSQRATSNYNSVRTPKSYFSQVKPSTAVSGLSSMERRHYISPSNPNPQEGVR
mmetsp:Transcript_10760/g.10882  ORF Transcript_10760/g.10882 Transcript_10760/m.10882 type:complete len:124 (+) Transcript_10760:673-1044(+)